MVYAFEYLEHAVMGHPERDHARDPTATEAGQICARDQAAMTVAQQIDLPTLLVDQTVQFLRENLKRLSPIDGEVDDP